MTTETPIQLGRDGAGPAEPPHGRSLEEAGLELLEYGGGHAAPAYGEDETRYGAEALAVTEIPSDEPAALAGWVPPSSYWMAGVPDHVNLRDMSIPGTHESAAYQENVWSMGYALCQDRDLDWQLNNGVRYLDIRLRRMDSKVFSVHHGDYYLKQMFGDVLQVCRNFLAINPSETILMRISQTKSNVSAGEFAQTFNHYLDTYWGNSGMRHHFHISPSFPTLGQARGKIVLMSGWPYLGYGLPFSNESVVDLKDDWNKPTVDNKKRSVSDQLSKATNTAAPKQKLIVNYTSAIHPASMTPWNYAARLNPYTRDLLNGVGSGKTAGVVVMDYIDRPAGSTSGGRNDLPLAILKLNQFSSTPTGPRALTAGTTPGSAVNGPVYQGIQNQSFNLRMVSIQFPHVVYNIINSYSGLALTMSANGVVTMEKAENRDDQKFTFVSQNDGSWGIRGTHNTHVLTMNPAGIVTGTPYGGNTYQSFNTFPQADNSTGIRSKYHWVGPNSA
ncbi:phosphatidylinositol-specific phospholipase C domain-containing protein [Nocardia gipuzkoensis]